MLTPPLSPLSGEAVFARCLSALKAQRVAAAKVLSGPSGAATEAAAAALKADKASFVESIRQALLASKIVSYAQVTGLPDCHHRHGHCHHYHFHRHHYHCRRHHHHRLLLLTATSTSLRRASCSSPSGRRVRA